MNWKFGSPLAPKIKNYLFALWLPFELALILVLQNLAFTSWLNISPAEFILRRCWVNFSLGLIIYAPPIFLKKHWKYMYLFTVGLIISCVFIAQFTYFNYAGGFLQVTALKLVFMVPAVSGTIKTLFSWRLLIFVANLLVVALGLILEAKSNFAKNKMPILTKLVTATLILLVGFSGYAFLAHREKIEWGNSRRLYSEVYDMNSLVSKVGIINFSLEDLAKYISRANKVKPNDINFVLNWSKNQTTDNDTKKYFGLAKNRNLILIQVESLDNAVINRKINGQEITPSLNELLKQGLYFNNYYSEVGLGNTADAEFVIDNSLYALPDDVAFVDYAQNNYNALPKLLKDNGYHTFVLHGDVPTFWNRANIYPRLGYDQWFSKDDYIVTRKIGLEFADLGDEDFFNQSLVKMESLPQPFLATLMTISSHTPFKIPTDLQTLNLQNQTNLNDQQKQYLQSIHYADKAIGEFIDQLKQTNLYANSIIAIFGDHQSYTGIGQALVPNLKLANSTANQVPLILIIPQTNLTGINNSYASHLDLYPTITNLLGLKQPQNLLGQDILNAKSHAVVQRNNVFGTIKTILSDNLIFEANEDGEFEHGTCLGLPGSMQQTLQSCQNLYSQQKNIIRASDIIVKANMLNRLTSQ